MVSSVLLVILFPVCMQGFRFFVQQDLNAVCLPYPAFLLECADAPATDVCDKFSFPPRCKRKVGKWISGSCSPTAGCPHGSLCEQFSISDPHGDDIFKYICNCKLPLFEVNNLCDGGRQAQGEHVVLMLSLLASLVMQLTIF